MSTYLTLFVTFTTILSTITLLVCYFSYNFKHLHSFVCYFRHNFKYFKLVFLTLWLLDRPHTEYQINGFEVTVKKIFLLMNFNDQSNMEMYQVWDKLKKKKRRKMHNLLDCCLSLYWSQKKLQKNCLSGTCKDRWHREIFSFTGWYQISFLSGQNRKIKIYTEPKHKIQEMDNIQNKKGRI